MNGRHISALLLVAGCSQSPASSAPASPEHDPHGHHGHGHQADGAHGPAAHDGHVQHGDMQHRFEDAEAWAKRFDDPERDAWQKPDAVVASLKLSSAARVADLGAGTGYFAVRLARAVPAGQVYAIDIEPDMVRYLTERGQREGLANLSAVQGRADGPALPEPVDVVFLCDVYHHLTGRSAYFAEVAAGLRPGGRVVIVDFKPDAPEGTPGPPARHRIGVPQVDAELADAGLVRVALDESTLPFQYVATYERR